MVHSYPPDCMPLGEAFEKAVLALEKVHCVELTSYKEFGQRSGEEIAAVFSSLDEHESRRRVVERMHDAIVIELELRVYVWNPATGYQLLYIDETEWMKMTTMSFGLPGLESVDTEGRLRLLKNSEFDEWWIAAETDLTPQAAQSSVVSVAQIAASAPPAAGAADESESPAAAIARKLGPKMTPFKAVLERIGYYPDRQQKSMDWLRDRVARELKGYEQPKEKAALKKIIQRLYKS